jgi:hypothetical protein
MARFQPSIISIVLLLASASVAAQIAEHEQLVELRPGWNAIHVEVEPTEDRIDAVFADIPVASVWRWIPQQAGARFIEDPAEGLQNIEGWFAWFPETRPEALLTNLFRLDANTAYLVHVEGTQSHQVTLRGRPELVPIRWQTDAFTLTGLPVALSNPPTFAEFFANSAAHQGQPIYRLDDDGRWQVVDPASDVTRAGEAYWIFTEGNSRYQGRLNVVLEQGESLEYAAALDQIRIVLRNRSTLPGSFQIRRLNGATMPLSFRYEDPETGDVGWPTVPETLVLNVPERDDVFLTLGILRREFSASRMEQILEITDELGERVVLHAGGNTVRPFVAPTRSPGTTATAVRNPAGPDLAGLWIGEVEVDAVSESQQAGVTPTPAPQTFAQRFLIHVDTAGQVRLLKDVIQMWEEGTLVPSDEDPSLQEIDQPGRYVLLTDPALINLYTGAVNRAGTSVGQRYSTVAYDFQSDTQLFDGEFGPGNQISTTLVVAPDLPTNPFLHRYHPDHDNLDPQYLPGQTEAYQVVREMRLIFTVEDPLGRTPPGWGNTLVGGFFEESITGLHKNTIFTSGQFRLRRISAVPVLNQ